jgi:hypothetical protein
VNIGSAEHRLLQVVGEVGLVQPLQDSAPACPTATRHISVHSKSSVKLVIRLLDTNETPRNAEGSQVFYF